MREFKYQVSGHKGNSEYIRKIKALDGVSSVSVEGDLLIYGLDGEADEYDILAKIVDISDEEGVNFYFDVSENEDNRPIEPLIDKNQDGSSVDLTAEKSADEGKRSQGGGTGEALLTQQEKRSAAKSENKFRLGELILSVALLIASLFFEESNEVFSARSIFIILSFAIAGYEVVYNGFIDIVKKRFFDGNLAILISSIVLILIGEPLYSVIIMVLFCLSKYVQTLYAQRAKNRIEDCFYTGGDLPVTVDGAEKNRADLKVGDIILLKEGEVLPCDGVALTLGEVDSFSLNYSLETSVKEGDAVYAGSAVLSDEFSYRAEKDFGESVIDERRAAFEEKTSKLGGSLFQKIKKAAPYIDFGLLIAAVLLTFIMPIFSETYATGLAKWGLYGALILVLSNFKYAAALCEAVLVNAYAESYYNGVEFGENESFTTLARANSAKVSVAVLAEADGNALKTDALGAMRELVNSGIKNLTTDFDGFNANEEVVKKVDFKATPFKGEKTVYIGDKSGDIGLIGGDNKVLNGEVSYIPYAYKMAKRTNKKFKFANVLNWGAKLLLAVGLVLVPTEILPAALFGAIGALVYAIGALTALTAASKIR